jgi:prepilin-type N-terminal cleavage/methylation domain-containing protein
MSGRRDGFTLVEVLLAMVVSVVLLTVIAQGMASAHRGVARAERLQQATLLASRWLAELEGGTWPTVSSSEIAAFEEDPRFSWSAEIFGAGELREVTLRVLWTEDQRELVRVVRLMRLRS